ncbi:histidinol-phosphate aminotransferase [Xylariaceae sp. AK1471]|nr:histidinol-phosphate aminotransferase [Xylariaceae sp. AK1471]
MSAFNLQTCARPNILALRTYRCARDDYKDDGTNVLLDANESAWGPSLLAADATAAAGASAIGINPLSLNRYPDPHQHALKKLLCNLRNINPEGDSSPPLAPENVFVGVSSDEPIDALMRCFCAPGRDAILVCPPTYGMYAVFAQVNDVTAFQVPLSPAPDFQLDIAAISATLSANPCIKLIYLASPGNPTGSLLARSDIQQLLAHPTWNGVVVVDEAYVDYAPEDASLTQLVTEYPNLAVVHTFSKAFGMAGIRLGVAFTSAPIARLLNSLKAPYNVSSLSSALASYCIGDKGLSVMRQNREKMVAQRNRLLEELPKISGVGRMRGGTDGNFLLYEILDAQGNPDSDVALSVYEKLAGVKGVVVRFRGKEHGCLGCLRITVGTEEEMTKLLDSLRKTLIEVRGTE